MGLYLVTAVQRKKKSACLWGVGVGEEIRSASASKSARICACSMNKKSLVHGINAFTSLISTATRTLTKLRKL
jgi:hypothetical protein